MEKVRRTEPEALRPEEEGEGVRPSAQPAVETEESGQTDHRKNPVIRTTTTDRRNHGSTG